MADWTYRCEYVCCGRCDTRCAHGPYWYGYRRESGKLKKKYFGKADPRPGAPTPEDRQRESYLALCEMMLHSGTASDIVACAVLGIDHAYSRDQVYRAYRAKQLEHHPDRGGSKTASQGINAAWSWLKAWYNW